MELWAQPHACVTMRGYIRALYGATVLEIQSLHRSHGRNQLFALPSIARPRWV